MALRLLQQQVRGRILVCQHPYSCRHWLHLKTRQQLLGRQPQQRQPVIPLHGVTLHVVQCRQALLHK